ncbi:hypothetical protein RESH_04647 [Rhodopirellula europaea SH398]|uniref:Uncharacterized protein n=1 Tax=Rhodopirellula europaea SH398 TaxID=1263868 RepID=M5RZP4_9BACT|nr:hypothetical protein RESH_04647 [Rhodopirellula europaea SH398]
MFVQRCGDAQDNRVDFAELFEVGSGPKFATLDLGGDGIARNVFDVRPAGVDGGGFVGVDVEPTVL